MWRNREKFVETPDHHRLLCESWIRDDAEFSFLIVHGQGEHSGSYNRFIQHLLQNPNTPKMNIHTFDFRGHGRSDGRRGYAKHTIQYVEDLESILSDLQKAKPPLPLFVLAHSMGGLVVSEAQTLPSFQKRFPNIFRGQILSAPLFQVALQVPTWKIKSAKFINQVFPTLTLGNEISDDMLTDDASIRDEFQRDPLRHQKISPGVFLGFFDFFQDVRENASSIQTPTLLFMSELDPVVSYPAAKDFFEQLGSSDKKIIPFSIGKHELLNEISRDKIYQLVIEQLTTWRDQYV